MSTFWPEVNVVVLTVTFWPLVPTVRPSATTVPVESLNRASAAVPLADAVALIGVPLNVNTPPEIVPHGSDNVIVDSTVV
jgi:hypothetical protein